MDHATKSVGWVKFNDFTMELDNEHLAEAKDEAYSEWVVTLVPQKDSAFTLASLGEVTIEKQAT